MADGTDGITADQIQRVALEPGDLVVVSGLPDLDLDQSSRLRALVQKDFPDHLVLLCTGETRIAVLGKDQRIRRIEDKVDALLAMLNTLVQALGEDDLALEEKTLDGAVVGGERDQTQSLG